MGRWLAAVPHAFDRLAQAPTPGCAVSDLGTAPRNDRRVIVAAFRLLEELALFCRHQLILLSVIMVPAVLVAMEMHLACQGFKGLGVGCRQPSMWTKGDV